MKFCLLILVASLALVACEDSQCSTAFDKSAVTPEAAKEAAKAKLKQPTLDSEVYSSKVKSNILKSTNKTVQILIFQTFISFETSTIF